MFEPKELKSVEIDIEKGIFNLNGEPVSHCVNFYLDGNVERDDRFHLRILTTVEPEFYGAFDACGVKVNKCETKRCKCLGCGKRWHLQDAKFCVNCGEKLQEPEEHALTCD